MLHFFDEFVVLFTFAIPQNILTLLLPDSSHKDDAQRQKGVQGFQDYIKHLTKELPVIFEA